MNETNETAVIACEIKISVTGRSFEEVHQLIERIREDVEENYKLEIKFDGDFFKT